MARINLAQAINLNLMKKVGERPVPVTLELKRGVNDLSEALKSHPDLDEDAVLKHPYILKHIELGGVSLIPDPMDPEAAAAAAEEIARQARAQAEAYKTLKDAEKAKVEGALAAAREKAETTKPLGDSQPGQVGDGGKPVPAVMDGAAPGHEAPAT